MTETREDGRRGKRRVSLARAVMRGAYAARQATRVGWYTSQRLLTARAVESGDDDADPGEETKRAETPLPSEPTGGQMARGARSLMPGLRALFERDLANAEAGLYPMPRDADGGFTQLIAQTRALFRDLPDANRRRKAKDGQEVWRKAQETGEGAGLPRYYLQNFHYQTDGYLTDHSARLYDAQVESLFAGTGNAMRRQALVPIAHHVADRDQREIALADIACGTGRFLRTIREAYPRMKLTGIDLSEAYLREARRHLERRYPVRLAMGNAEQIPLPDASQDIVTSVYLFHELPQKVRRIAGAEFARILKPGGILVFMDSLQIGDTHGYDRILESFPGRFHEPYYDNYIRDDLDAIFAEGGLEPVRHVPAFLSKVSVYRKPDEA
ncbi:class I SAM-dependent methyltransferase [Tepidamorphus sp. 3E244]|uniref:class I SAM-dependent methyltransferase n=1 Tax=Tepidamorphus sp. 3E244 TaxID=3385498 RepID=UPI0038FC053A